MMKIQTSTLLFLGFCSLLEKTLAWNKCPESVYGSQKMPGRSCADILKRRCDELKDGVYWVRLGNRSLKPFPVFCNMQAGGWTLVFKVIAGVSGRPAAIWNLPFSNYEFSLAALNTNNDFKHHYKNRIVQNWNQFKPSEARVVMYNQNKEEVVMRYNAVNSDNKSWFSQARIIEAPWQDILTEQKNYFTVIGPCHGEGCRDFFINHFYGGCGADEGWFSVGDCHACRWENRFPVGVKLIYSKEATLTNYNTYKNVGTADVFSVYLR